MDESSERILLTRGEAAKLCGLCEKTLANHTYPHGRLIAVRIGRAIRYTTGDLFRWAATLKQSGESPSKGGAYDRRAIVMVRHRPSFQEVLRLREKIDSPFMTGEELLQKQIPEALSDERQDGDAHDPR